MTFMKRFTLLLTLSMAASLCIAERIPESEAYATALRFVQGKTLSSQPRLKKGDTPGGRPIITTSIMSATTRAS